MRLEIEVTDHALGNLACSLNEKLAELLNVDFLNAILRKTELLKKTVENK